MAQSTRRTPHGVRGLKSIDIKVADYVIISRTPHGVRGLKSARMHEDHGHCLGRTPHGVRGLKSSLDVTEPKLTSVALRMECVD